MKEWTKVTLPRANLYGLNNPNRYYSGIGNIVHYTEICDWCDKTFGKESDTYCHEIDHKTGLKYFWFKDDKHTILFTLKWS